MLLVLVLPLGLALFNSLQLIVKGLAVGHFKRVLQPDGNTPRAVKRRVRIVLANGPLQTCLPLQAGR